MMDVETRSPLLQVDGLENPDGGAPLSWALAPGGMLVVHTLSEDFHTRLAHQLLGLEALTCGEVLFFGQPLPPRGSKELALLRSRIGVVFARGGLISNLKVLENLLLPVQYHRLPLAGDPEAAALAMLKRVGYRGAPMALPGLLSNFEKKQVVLARAMLSNPDLMLYDALTLGLNLRERQQLLGIAREFHAEKLGRGSLFLANELTLAAQLPAATLLNLAKEIPA